MSRAKVQHYVPQFLLSNFGKIKNDDVYIHVFDKSNRNEFRTNIKNIASESGFYALKIGDDSNLFKEILTALDGNASQILQKIIKEDSISFLTLDNINILCKFFSIQCVRTKACREYFTDIIKKLTLIQKGNQIEQKSIKCVLF
jgi:hypothetical protein